MTAKTDNSKNNNGKDKNKDRSRSPARMTTKKQDKDKQGKYKGALHCAAEGEAVRPLRSR
jgi:hypothetical protein